MYLDHLLLLLWFNLTEPHTADHLSLLCDSVQSSYSKKKDKKDSNGVNYSDTREISTWIINMVYYLEGKRRIRLVFLYFKHWRLQGFCSHPKMFQHFLFTFHGLILPCQASSVSFGWHQAAVTYQNQISGNIQPWGGIITTEIQGLCCIPNAKLKKEMGTLKKFNTSLSVSTAILNS